MRLASLVLLLLLAPLLSAQKNLAGSAEIKLALEKLNNTGSVLMIAAHPDDENTAVLAYFARGVKTRTAYLALNRGEGGQNLIGAEQGELIGLIRTQELLAARRIDGAEQFFTRAIDFGFSKTAEETFQKWGKDKILGDVVWIIRQFQPDIIINRFSGTPRDGHGNHQVSAMLGKEAFQAAADPQRFPEQLAYVKPWQAKRLFWNVFAFTREQEQAAAQQPNKLLIDTGAYDPLLGYSYTEIAGMSRSQHRSQGMGSPERKGTSPNYLVLLAGDPAAKDPLEGVDLTWSRIEGGAETGKLLARANAEFVPEHPEKSVPVLAAAYGAMRNLKGALVERKRRELVDVIALCSGISIDASADRYAVVPGDSVKVNVSAVQRLPSPVTARSLRILFPDGKSVAATSPLSLPWNQAAVVSVTVPMPADAPYTQPYWLEKPHSLNTYEIADIRQVGPPESMPRLRAQYEFQIGTQEFTLMRPVVYRYVDPIYGELSRPLTVVPPVALSLVEKVLLFPTAQPKPVEVVVTANKPQSGEVKLTLPQGWAASPASQPFQFAKAGEKATVAFQITPAATRNTGELRAVAVIGGQTVSAGQETISYSHIPPQTIFPEPTADLVREDVKTLAKSVGYIMGAGDDVPQALRQLGCEVTLLDSDQLASGDLSRFDAIVTGVRAYNTRPDVRANQQRLLAYARNGGTLVQQYNVFESGMFAGNPENTANLGPFPITLSRDRVTVEEATVSFPNPKSVLLHQPNEITPADFANWVQERGLYFPSKWSPEYQTLLSAHDPDEKDLPGGTLYVKYGQGAYVYTAYSWFRQLPAGVPGAYRIFANMISAGKSLR